LLGIPAPFKGENEGFLEKPKKSYKEEKEKA